MKNIKRIFEVSFLTLSLFFSIKNGNAQVISDHYFGENAWMPDTIGNYKACQEPPCILYGKLHKQWANVKNSGTSIVRFGGIAPDKNMPTNYQYIKMIDSIRANGMEPIIQVPFHNFRYTAEQAAEIVHFINVTQNKKIKYWIIANEPDLVYSYTTAAQIAKYFRPFASAMKAIDPSIIIIGPEISSFNQTIMNGLTTPNGPDDITGKDEAGRYYLDVISFHTYPFNGSQTRTQVISKLTAPYSLEANLVYLNARVATCNTAHNRTGTSLLKTAITEANINWQNNASDNLNGVGANSFIGGQFVAEMMGIGMKNGLDFINIWSVVEGNSTTNNIGFIDPSTNYKKPMYHHFKLLAGNFKGNYVHGTTNQVNVKSFGSKDDQQITVLILNEDQTKNYYFTVKLNTSSIAASSELNININAGLSKEYTGVINNQSTTLLKFDGVGNLIKKIEYKLSGNADANLAPTVTVLASALSAAIIPGGTTSFCEGGNVVFNASVGAGYTYQWKKNNIAIAGATNPSYIGNSAGNYSVNITSAGITTSSATETITMLPAPIATITPQGATSFIEGGNVALNATTGTGYLYQWKKDGVSINGATNASFVASQQGDYQLRTTLGTCKNWSAPLLISVFPKATITAAGPTNFCPGGSVKLNANVVNGYGYGYQWKKDNIEIAGATDSSYIAALSGNYSVVVTKGGISNASTAIAVIAMPVPVATITPLGSTTVCSGSVGLQANTGSGLAFQWKKDNNAIAGATNSLYSVTTSGSYQIRITEGLCTSWSAPINVNVQSFRTPTISPDGSLTFCSGGKVVLYANTCSDYLYQWKKNGANIRGATSSNYTATSSGNYQVKITSGILVDWSAPITVAVNHCKPIASREYTPDSTTVISLANAENVSEDFEINVFPNPSNGKFTVQMNKENSGQNAIDIHLLNSTGQVVYRDNFKFLNGSEEIDVRENVVAGLYILMVINGNDITTKRIIIQ